MLDHTLDSARGILYVRPQSALGEDDFAQLAAAVILSQWLITSAVSRPIGPISTLMAISQLSKIGFRTFSHAHDAAAEIPDHAASTPVRNQSTLLYAHTAAAASARSGPIPAGSPLVMAVSG